MCRLAHIYCYYKELYTVHTHIFHLPANNEKISQFILLLLHDFTHFIVGILQSVSQKMIFQSLRSAIIEQSYQIYRHTDRPGSVF